VSGSIVHGVQAVNPEERANPPGYYTLNSGAALAINNHPKRQAGEAMRIGVIGLGTGTLAAYGQPDDVVRFYEIDPQVIRLARNIRYFTYLRDTPALVEVVEGDGRLSLERELAEGRAQNYDALIFDAFSGDSIPAHLVSREAIALYLAHLAEDGVLVFHISNKYIDLEPVLEKAGEAFGLYGSFIQGVPQGPLEFPSRWVVFSRSPQFFEDPEVMDASRELRERAGVQLWTDDFNNLFEVIR
jgi:spermidine synthase